MKKLSFLLAVTSLFSFASCGMFKDMSIAKRHYSNGYYVHVRDHRSTDESAAQPVPTDSAVNPAQTAVNTENAPPAEKNIPQQQAAPTDQKTTAENKTADGQPDYNQTVKTHVGEENSFRSRAWYQMEKVFTTPADDTESALVLLLLIILAIIIPPLAVLIKEGLTVNFLLVLIFWLLGFGFLLVYPGVYVGLGIFGLIAIIWALLVVLDVIRKND